MESVRLSFSSRGCRYGIKMVSFFPRPQIVVHLSFGLDDSFKRAESLQMGFSYVGNDPVVRFGYLYQLLDVRPGWLAPISTTARSCSGRRRSKVRGTPM